MAFEYIHWLLIVALLGGAIWTDIRINIIPNRLIAAVLLATILMAISGESPLDSLGGCLVGLLSGGLLLSPFYLLRLLGAGDVKLMAAVGGLMGWPAVGWVVLLSLLCAGLLSLALALRWGVLQQVLVNVKLALLGLMYWRQLDRRASEALVVPLTGRRSPHAVAVALAVLLYAVGLW